MEFDFDGLVFVSQPMKNRSEEDIKAERNRIEEGLAKIGLKAAESYFEDFEEKSREYRNPSLFYLAKSLEILAGCGAAYFADGWQDARGCRIEHECAVQYGIQILRD